MQITGDWLDAVGTQKVLRLLNDNGFEAYCVGGCVRNALLGVPVADIDIATSATPDEVLSLATAADIKVIPTGLDHGTLTLIADSVVLEVTTYRQDVDTDGRRATIAFASDIREDARRRDFTVNALYVAADGTLVDPLDGYDDIGARKIRFIENPTQRIKEDYLRILRFFRFHAWYGDAKAGPDSDGLAACAKLASGIKTLSKERIGAEMAKLLAAADPAPAVATMEKTGILMQILSGADTQALAPLVHIERMLNLSPRWQRRLAVLGGQDVAKALRLSRKDADHLKHVRGASDPLAVTAYKFGADVALDSQLLVSATLGTMPPNEFMAAISRGANATFPVVAADLFSRFEKGPELGAAMRKLETAWIDSDFSLTKAELLQLS